MKALRWAALSSLAGLLAACSSTVAGGTPPPPPPASPFVSYPLPASVNGPNAIAPGPNATQWFVTSGSSKAPSAVGFVTNAGKVTLYFGGKHRGLHDDAIGFFGIAEGPDENMWFSEPLNGTIVRITPTGNVTEAAAAGKLPFKVTPGPNRTMWYTLNGSSAIGEMTTATHPTATAFTIPSPRPSATSNPQAIVAGADGNLYFTDCGASSGGIDGIGQVVPSAPVRVNPEIAVPTQGSCPQGIVAVADGSVWFLESNPASGVYNLARLVPAAPFSRSSIVEFPMGIPAGKLAFLIAASDGSLWTANNGTKPGSITHVSDLPPPTTSAMPALATIAVAQQPIPIAPGHSGTIWFGSPAVSALVRYAP